MTEAQEKSLIKLVDSLMEENATLRDELNEAYEQIEALYEESIEDLEESHKAYQELADQIIELLEETES